MAWMCLKANENRHLSSDYKFSADYHLKLFMNIKGFPMENVNSV